MKFFSLFLLSFFLFLSCDKIEEPYIKKPTNDNGNNNGKTIIKKVFIEDYTGHRCGNCPRAHETIDSISNLYKGRVVSIAIHSGYYSEPFPAQGYNADFRTSVGNELTSYFGCVAYPSGIINRVKVNNYYFLTYQSWLENVAIQLDKEPMMGISIDNNYNESTRLLTTTCNITFVKAMDTQQYLSVFIIEDSIVSPQTDYSLSPTKVENYVHKHMLRGSMNGTFGTALPQTVYNIGDTTSMTFTSTLNSNWNHTKSSVVAFIHCSISEEVFQVEEKKIVD